jgi:hypothetical protein
VLLGGAQHAGALHFAFAEQQNDHHIISDNHHTT